MKKSKLYELAQIAVIENNKLPANIKLDIVQELMERQSLEKYCEESDGSENDNTEN